MQAAFLQQAADELYAAERDRRPIEPLTDRASGMTVTDAYRIQQINIDRRLRAGGRIAGHKIGLTARAMQQKFGVSEPDYGHLLDDMVLDDGASLDVGELIAPQIEVEPAFVLGSDLTGPGVSVADVLAATDHLRICFEIIDSRIIGWRIRLQDTVADNGSSARVVFGPARLRPTALALDALPTTLEIDGRLVESGNTRDVLGHPANGIVWLVNTIAAYGVGLKAGHIVLPGTPIRSHRIAGHREACGRIEGLGEVRLTLTGRPAVTAPDS